MSAKTKKSGRGGAREGAGRKQLYGEPLTEAFSARVNDEQGHALGVWCRRNKIPPATLFREVGLARAGAAALGIGIEKAKGTADKDIVLNGAMGFPVKCTRRQAVAIRRFCATKSVPPGTWLREAALEFIGKPELGLRGPAAAVAASL